MLSSSAADASLDDSLVGEDAVRPGLAHSGHLLLPGSSSSSESSAQSEEDDYNHYSEEVSGNKTDHALNEPDRGTFAPSTPTRSDAAMSYEVGGDILSSFRSARKAIHSSGSGSGRRNKSLIRGRSDSIDEIIADYPSIQVDPLTGAAAGGLVASPAVAEYHNLLTSARQMIALTLPSDRIMPRIDSSSKKNIMRGAVDRRLMLAEAVLEVAASLRESIATMLPSNKTERRPSMDVLIDNDLLVLPDSSQCRTGISPNTSPMDKVYSPVSIAINQSSPAAYASPGQQPTHPHALGVYEYLPYRYCDKRLVTVVALKALRELRTRELLEQMEFDGAKEMVLSCRLCVSMAVERYVRDGNNDLLVAVLFEMAVRIYPEES